MVLVRQPVGIYKMGVETAQLRRSFVHDLSKHGPVRGMGDVLCQSVTDLVCGADQDGLKALLQRQLLPYIHGDMAAVPGSVENGIMGKGDDLVQLALLRHDEGGKSLGGAGGIFLLVDVFGVQNHAGIRIHEYGGLRIDHRPYGPVGHLVGLYRHGPLPLQPLFPVSEGGSMGL